MKKTLAIVTIILILAGGYWWFKANPTTQDETLEQVVVNGQKIIIEIADTPTERAQGLSGRESLEPGHGLLFIFENPGIYGFWMKEMNFPIDIFWLDGDFNIVDSKLNAQPDSYPEVYTPKNKALYVLETNPGEVKP